ncbi:glycoside hydrolase family 30 protein [Cohnella zeiphila]|uniref:Glycosyl hydrolase n=1 Tax=Cohnella zeiphila TaxID=2761120 RepID=A0A7X0SS01_9BACL|nr:glycoside hydrolase family 30 beta sandwich domain-containing protein [Cohnella zeiphila]MBB6734891.1 glycosyl hydrolase [Cohnella zeiphila]
MGTIETWLTTVDGRKLLDPQDQGASAASGDDPAFGGRRIRIDEEARRQRMEGFGASFTDASAWLVGALLDEPSRETVMKKLFDREEGIGLTLLRQPIGSSDYTTKEYSYDDAPEDEEDFELRRFSIDHDRAYILPLLREAKALRPDLQLMASPWSPPGWMKTSGRMIAGTLRPECYPAYANYFVAFLKAYEAEGFRIPRITVQNEPGYEPKEYPGMIMTAEEQLTFIRDHLGPAIEAAGLDTKVLCYDHNWDITDYAIKVLGDPACARYVAGTAWHCYGGEHEAMSVVGDAFPGTEIWFTEASGGAWIPPFREAYLTQMKHVVRSVRNGSNSVVWWNVALDERNGPTVLSNSTCRGLIRIDQATREVTYNLDYYTMGHISKFVVPGAYRLESTDYRDELETAAFRNPDGSTVLIVSSRTEEEQDIRFECGGRAWHYRLPGEAAVTFKW